MVQPLVAEVRKTKVLMDGGSDIKILYKDPFDKLKIKESELRPSDTLFHRVILGR